MLGVKRERKEKSFKDGMRYVHENRFPFRQKQINFETGLSFRNAHGAKQKQISNEFIVTENAKYNRFFLHNLPYLAYKVKCLISTRVSFSFM